MYKIALEEHFLCPGMTDYWEPSVASVPEPMVSRLRAKLHDFGDMRLEEMDQASIAYAVLALAGPGVQAEHDPAVAVRRAREANDFLAAEMARRPDRYGGFAHLPMQDSPAAADELQRCVQQLGMQGAMIDGHTHGVYLDDPRHDVFWERVADLGVPIYLHPADPPALMPAIAGISQLRRATWEWGVETATHALRLVFAGTFERFPGARLILGHMGETLPYLLWRFDSRVSMLYGLSGAMKKLPSEYIRSNILVTTSGMCDADPLRCAVSALGEENVMFSVDYPFEQTQTADRFIEQAEMTESLRARLCHGNAEKALGLPAR